MRPRFPLSARILLWFFANLVLIGAAVYVFIEFEFHLGPESLLGGRAGRRVEALADLVNGEINSAAPDQWGDVLTRAGNLYGLHLAIVSPDGREISGQQITLPDEVQARLYRPRPPMPPGQARGPRQPAADTAAPVPPPPPERAGDEDAPGRKPAEPPPGPRERRMIHTDKPSRYWLLLPLDPPPAAGRRAGPPLTLIAVSESIGLGGLVLDTAPWVAAAAGVVVFSLLFWLPLVHGITRSIREMTGATARIAEGQFDMPIQEKRSDELGLLAQSINQMAGRLAGFVNGQKRFLGDIAHELCSPLARAQMALGILEQKVSAGPLADIQEEIQQMSSLVNELLSFSKASLAAGRIELQRVSLHEAVARAIERESLTGPALQSRIDEELWVKAEPDLFCRALSNLLRNAVKYAGAAGPVEIEAQRIGNDVLITISDQGPGVPEEALTQLFDPFYRVDVSRARETGGAGLGLAIVKTCIESCGGQVTCHNREPHGLSVVITLPVG